MEITVYIRDHEISAYCSIGSKDEGIGPYEFWGFCGNDKRLIPVVDEVEGIWLIRRGLEKKEEDVPKCSNISVKKKYGMFEWEHAKVIKSNPEIIDKLNLKLQEFPMDEIFEQLQEE